MKIRKIFVCAWLLLLIACTGLLFWYNEWRYSLPTPVPIHYAAVAAGTIIKLPPAIAASGDKPVFLHFFNPDCPCSRFNIKHVQALVRLYGQRADFRIVLVTGKNYTEKQIQQRFSIDIPVLRDSTLAGICGVYSTPQAAIIDNRNHSLFFRGNYNRSRYCSDKNTNYAQTALETLLDHRLPLTTDPMAFKAYGCSLPGCRRIN